MTYRSSCKCFFQFTRRFWEENEFNGFGASDRIGEIWHPTFDQPGSRGLLITYTQGPVAKKLANLSAGKRLDYAIDVVEEVHAGATAVLESAVTHSWDDEPWSRGAQSVAWHLAADELAELARREGRVHFAGEHTAPRRWLGWMNGALLSGERAAREIRRRSLAPRDRMVSSS